MALVCALLFFMPAAMAFRTKLNRDDSSADSTDQRNWCDWKTAGWKKEDLALAKKQTEDEWQDTEFQMRLLKQSVKSGIECCTNYNKQLQIFQKPDNFMEYLNRSKAQVSDEGRTVIFVFGPSAAGKTSIVASLGKLREEMAYQFPAMTFDGADARDVSEVWKRYAQDGGKWEAYEGCSGPGSHKDGTRHWVPHEKALSCLLSKYFDDVAKPYCKPNLKKLMYNWIEEYKPKTVLIPETAVPCYSTMLVKACKILQTINKFKKLGYKVQFVVVYAPMEQVKEAGTRRALTEGKPYSSRGYAMALKAAEKLYKKFGKDSEFIFVNNTYRTNQLPDELSWKTYQKLAGQAMRRQILEMMPKPFGNGL